MPIFIEARPDDHVRVIARTVVLVKTNTTFVDKTKGNVTEAENRNIRGNLDKKHSINGTEMFQGEGRRLRWRLPGNMDSENLQLGINNVRSLFLKSFPEFNVIFPRGEDGLIEVSKRKEARNFILQRIGRVRDFILHIGGVPLQRKYVSYFEGKFFYVVHKSFESWGVDFYSMDINDLSVIRSAKRPWSLLNDVPGLMGIMIEKEARRLVEAGLNLKDSDLRKADLRQFSKVVTRYYPGGVKNLRITLGLGYDDKQSRKPAGFWGTSEGFKKIEEDAWGFFIGEGVLSLGRLRKKGKVRMAKLISRFYPGGVRELRKKLRISHPRDISRGNYTKGEEFLISSELGFKVKKEILDQFSELIRQEPNSKMSLLEFTVLCSEKGEA